MQLVYSYSKQSTAKGFSNQVNFGMLIYPFFAALCGVVMYNYLKVKDVRASQLPTDCIPERIAKVSLCFFPPLLSDLI